MAVRRSCSRIISEASSTAAPSGVSRHRDEPGLETVRTDRRDGAYSELGSAAQRLSKPSRRRSRHIRPAGATSALILLAEVPACFPKRTSAHNNCRKAILHRSWTFGRTGRRCLAMAIHHLSLVRLSETRTPSKRSMPQEPSEGKLFTLNNNLIDGVAGIRLTDRRGACPRRHP